jgi:hypothetical protein
MLSNIWVWDPGSEKNLFRIPDPGVKKAPDPGSGSATLVNNNEDCKLNIPCGSTYLRRDGSRWLHMILMGRPFSTSKFIVSRALSAEKGRKILNNKKKVKEGFKSIPDTYSRVKESMDRGSGSATLN